MDVAKVDHLSVWKVMRALSGRQSLECTCGEPEQRQQYAMNGTIKNDPAFNSNKIAEAEVWLADFLERNLGSSAASGIAFTESDVHKAYKSLRQCASGIDGLSKKWIAPMVHLLIPQFTALFNYVYLEGTVVDDWTLGLVLYLRKKDAKSDAMDGMRGVHLLAFVRQWYASLLLPSLQELATRILPDEQQRVRLGGRVYASCLALFALMENYRLRGKRLFVCFLDIAKAFP